MEYTIDTEVYADGTLLGNIIYFNVAPNTRTRTHVVIKHVSENSIKIVPLELIEIQTKRAIVLPRQITWNDLTDYNAKYYNIVDNDQHLLMPKAYLHPLYYTQSHVDRLAEHTDADRLTMGISVYDNNAQKCGTVIKWIENATGKLMSFIIRVIVDGQLDIRIPIHWISYTKDRDLYLHVDRDRVLRQRQ